jgi:hypothetical protein
LRNLGHGHAAVSRPDKRQIINPDMAVGDRLAEGKLARGESCRSLKLLAES